MTEPGRRSGSRDNGLRAAGYVAIGDLDPRVAEALLDRLRDHGIAAYVSPTPGTRGGYLEVSMPSQLTDRLYVDSGRTDDARAHLDDESAHHRPPQPATPAPATPPLGEREVEAAWQDLLVSLQASSPAAPGGWPASEDVSGFDAAPAPVAPPPAEDEHFVPPPAPPFPRLRAVTVAAVAAIAAGVFIIVTGFDGGDLDWLAILAIAGGGASLVYHVRQGPPTDSGWDDGAVV